MYNPELLRDRPRPVQIVVAGVIPAALGALQGVLIGASARSEEHTSELQSPC